MTALLSTTYFGPVQWYQKLNRHDQAVIDAGEHYRKQTYRNRCIIATTNGLQALTVPIESGTGRLVRDIRISDHGQWRHLHWQALLSAYGESPFFEYYEDDLRPFFADRRWTFLLDFNQDICQKMCELIDIRPTWLSPSSMQDSPSLADYRDVINPKHPGPDSDFLPRPYYQVYQQKHGFQANLSVLDLLFNMGPESIFYL